MRKKELLRQLDEKNERIELLSRRVDTMQTLIESFQEREQAIVDAMTAAQAFARQQAAEAEANAQSIRSDAELQAETLLNRTREQAETMRYQAEEQAKRTVSEAERTLSQARAESAELLRRTEASVADYEKQIAAYNEAIEKSAAQALESSNRYAALLRERKLPLPDISEEVAGISGIPLAGPMDLPDAEDDPKRIMMNIYRLQNREIPVPPEGAAMRRPAYADGTQQTGREQEYEKEPPIPEEPAQEPACAVLPQEADDTSVPWATQPAQEEEKEQPYESAPPEAAETPAPESMPKAPEPAEEHEPAQEADAPVEPVTIPREGPGGDAEPDEVPTVTQYLVEEEVDAGGAYELSLDDLLNEIIQAGEKNNG